MTRVASGSVSPPLAAEKSPSGAPRPRDLLELIKPITWFAPMWAYACGAVSGGADWGAQWPAILLGVLLAGPLMCGASQAVNDWFDRHVDAINEPNRPVPSGRITGPWALGFAAVLTLVGFAIAWALSPWAFAAAVAAAALSWAYSAPPFRWKKDGWLGPAAVAISYESLAWVTGAAVVAGGRPTGEALILAALYGFGAHGIMTLNDFKAVEGDRKLGVGSLPVRLGVKPAAYLASAVMAAPQGVVIALLVLWGAPVHAAVVAGLLSIQLLMMARMAGDPKTYAPWYNATGTTFYVLGMLAAALAVGGLTERGGL